MADYIASVKCRQVWALQGIDEDGISFQQRTISTINHRSGFSHSDEKDRHSIVIKNQIQNQSQTQLMRLLFKFRTNKKLK